MNTTPFTVDEIKAYQKKHECGIYEAKEKLAGERLDAILDRLENGIRPGFSCDAREVAQIVRLLRIEQGRR